MEAVILIVIGIALIFLNVRAIKKGKQSFTSTLRNADADMEEVDIRLGEMRREFTETIAELQIEIEDLRDVLRKNHMMKSEEKNENKDYHHNKSLKDTKKKNEGRKNKEDREDEEVRNDKENISQVKIEDANVDRHTEKKDKSKVEKIIDSNIDNRIDNENKGIQINEVRKLIESGLTIDEISQKLGVGKGEVLLIKELYLK